MPKAQTRFVCSACGHVTSRWLGRCPECMSWNSFVEEAVPRVRSASHAEAPPAVATALPQPVTTIDRDAENRLSSGMAELDRVLGGGIVPGSVVLVGGDPGIGKSTLVTQVGHRVALREGAPVLYVTGEESPRQVRLRCERLGALVQELHVLGETRLDAIIHHIHQTKPLLTAIDSVQTTLDPNLESAGGTVSQVRQVAALLAAQARQLGMSVFLIGHVTKEGALAGPRVLEHMVDTVLYFEGDRHQSYRILRAVKNRFGPTDELGIFEMRDDGLHEVENPSAVLLAERRPEFPGSAVSATMEGTRPLLVEVQALVTRSFLSSPRRVINGLDYNRANMVMAVLEKRMGLRLGEHDVFINVAGGVRLTEPAADLAVALAVASSYWDAPVDGSTVAIGEVGLGGEVRSVAHTDRRLREAVRLGFGQALLPAGFRNRTVQGIVAVPVRTVRDATEAGIRRSDKETRRENE